MNFKFTAYVHAWQISEDTKWSLSHQLYPFLISFTRSWDAKASYYQGVLQKEALTITQNLMLPKDMGYNLLYGLFHFIN